MRFDQRKSLQQIEGQFWDEPESDATGQVQRCHRLRKVPIEALEADDFRVLIGQEIGLPVLVPIALELLADDPFLEALAYPGDLFSCLIRVPEQFWSSHPDSLSNLKELIRSSHSQVELVQPGDRQDAIELLQSARKRFLEEG